MTATQHTTRGHDHEVLVQYARDRRWRRITIRAADVHAGRSSEAVAAAERLLAVGLPAPDRDHRNSATPEGVSLQPRRNEDG